MYSSYVLASERSDDATVSTIGTSTRRNGTTARIGAESPGGKRLSGAR